MNDEIILFFKAAIEAHRYEQRARLLSLIYCDKQQKQSFEANNPDKEHAWDASIRRHETELVELNEQYKEALNYLKELDADKVIFR